MHIRNKSGYSILEVIITVAFLSIVITPMFALFNSLGTDSYDVRQKSIAYFHASNALEEYCSKSFDEQREQGEERVSLKDGFSLLVRQIPESKSLIRLEARVFYKSRQVEESIVVSRVVAENEK